MRLSSTVIFSDVTSITWDWSIRSSFCLMMLVMGLELLIWYFKMVWVSVSISKLEIWPRCSPDFVWTGRLMSFSDEIGIYK